MKVTSKINKAHLNIMKEVFQRAQIKTVDALNKTKVCMLMIPKLIAEK